MKIGLLSRFAVLIFLVASLSGLSRAQSDQQRIALVIGNGGYLNTQRLANSANDARDMSATLRRLDFEVLEGIDLDLNALRKISQEFSRKASTSKVALFYYAGHGVQVNGQNYIVPVDAALKSENDLDFEALSLNVILQQLERNAQVGLVFLDACRDNPFAQAWRARGRGTSAGRGLALVSDATGLLISFATQPGNIAQDGDSGRNSPFTRALLKHITTPGASINDIMIEVRKQVMAETGNKQVPWENSSLTAKFYFKDVQAEITIKPSRAENPDATITPAKPAVAPELQKFDPLAIEHAFWTSIQASSDPVLLREYIERFPRGVFVSIALSKLARIEIEAKAAPRAPEPDASPPLPTQRSAAIKGQGDPCPDSLLGGLTTEITCTCDDSKMSGSVWGTNLYTSDSKICAAALHAGVVKKEGGVVRVKGTAGAQSYTGTRRNGITSNGYSAYGWSYRFTGPVLEGTDKYSHCPNSMSTLRATKASLTCICSPSAMNGGSVWGTGTYTDDSIVCRAALHAGAVAATGGTITVVPAPGLRTYVGSQRNGVTSASYGAFQHSFRFTKDGG